MELAKCTAFLNYCI